MGIRDEFMNRDKQKKYGFVISRFTRKPKTKVVIDARGIKHVLHKTIALIDLYDENGNVLVKKGAIGPWIESKENLSQEGNCFGDERSYIWGFAKLKGDGFIKNTTLSGNAEVNGVRYHLENTTVGDNAYIHNADLKNCFVAGNSKIFNLAGYVLGEFKGYLPRAYGEKSNTMIEGCRVTDDTVVMGAHKDEVLDSTRKGVARDVLFAYVNNLKNESIVIEEFLKRKKEKAMGNISALEKTIMANSGYDVLTETWDIICEEKQKFEELCNLIKCDPECQDYLKKNEKKQDGDYQQ